MDEKEQNRIDLIRLRERMDMNRRQFADYFSIPYRTLQEWELGGRRVPEYLLRLMEYKVRMEGMGKTEQEPK